MQNASRREFLKRSAMATGAAALAGSVDLARGAHAAGSGRIKVALIGCGGRGNGAIDDCLSVNSDVTVVAVADVFKAPAMRTAASLRQKRAKQIDLPDSRVFHGFDAYQKAIEAGVDMVFLATPPGFRPMHYQAAVKAGKHVFMEKPCCVDASGYNTLVAANTLADQKNLKVGVGLQRRHDVRYLKDVQAIRDGQIGDVSLLRVYWNGNTPWIRPRQPKQTEMEYQLRNWYFFVWLCGDNIVEQHVHNLDVANWIKGDHPIEANGMGGRQVRKGRDVGHIFDHHFVEFTYKDGTKLYSQCRHQSGVWNSVGEHAHGSKGVRQLAPGRARNNACQQEHADLMAAIREGKKYNEGWYGATSSMTGVLGRMATYSGQLVAWEDAVAKGRSEMPARLAWDAPPRVLPDKDGLYEHAVPAPGVYKPY